MAWQDWAGLGAEGLNWWQSRANYKDAQQAIDKGLDKGREDITKWQQPYAEFGNRQMQGYEDLGQFDFQFDQSDPSYQWRFGEGERAALRSQAGQKAVGSGNTLARLTEYGQGMASQEYQNEFNRDLQGYNANKEYWGTGMKLGADVAQNMGNNLADMSIMAGANKAQLYNAQAQMNSQTIGNIADKLIGQGGAGGAVGDALKVASSMGLEGDSALSWVANKLGMAKNAVMGAVSGAANSVAGAAWGAFGAGPQTLSGGASAASGASGAGAAGIGATLAAASPLLAFGGIIALDKLLGGSPSIGKTLDKIKSSSDPLAYISQLSGSKMSGMLTRDSLIGDPNFDAGPGAKRGYLSSMIISTLPPEQIEQLKTRPDFGDIARDLLSALSIGRGTHAKVGEIGADPVTAFTKLFPELGDLAKSVSGLSGANRAAHDYNNTEDIMGSVHRTARKTYDAEVAAKRIILRSQFNHTLETMGIDPRPKPTTGTVRDWLNKSNS